jgi:TPR repeat protein
MIKNLTLNPRALPLLLGLLLIGGTACFSMQGMTPEELARVRAQQLELQRAQLEKMERDAKAGNPTAITNLARAYLFGTFGVTRDTVRGKELMEQAVALSHAPAQSELGWLLLAGRNHPNSGTVDGFQWMHDPVRGMILLKNSIAGTTCVPQSGARPSQAPAYYRVGAENDISEIYRAGKLVPQDIDQANLWLERSLVHCHYPTATMLANPERYGIVAGPVDRLAWLLLLPSTPQLEAARGVTSAEEMHAAEEESVKMRQAVFQSETQYPAPH